MTKLNFQMNENPNLMEIVANNVLSFTERQWKQFDFRWAGRLGSQTAHIDCQRKLSKVDRKSLPTRVTPAQSNKRKLIIIIIGKEKKNKNKNNN
jgi:hypothetical protein